MISIKSKQEIEIMRKGGKILAAVLKKIEMMAKPGVTTMELDKAAESLILSHGAKPAFKNYDGFPYSLCASVNDVIVHGLPSGYTLRNGDVAGLDLGVLYEGYNTDMAVTIGIGDISSQVKKLLSVTKEALDIGIQQAIVGNTVGDIGNAIQRYIESRGYGLVRDLCGHGIGKNIHEDPKIPNFGLQHKGNTLQEGMVICIEPMVTAGDFKLKKADDGYGFATKDGSLSAHFEHTLAIKKEGPEVLTRA